MPTAATDSESVKTQRVPRRRLKAAAKTATWLLPLFAVVYWLWRKIAFLNYDSAWSLNWMGSLIREHRRPNMDLPFMPTPHPLSDLVSAIVYLVGDPFFFIDSDPKYPLGVGPSGHFLEGSLVLIGLLALFAVGALSYKVGAAWFGWLGGALMALILLTREPLLSYGIRAYLDIPFVALLLAALLSERQQAANGTKTMVWLTLAGLLRPEAWFLAAAYFVYVLLLRRRGEPQPLTRLLLSRGTLVLAALAALAPLGWIVEGWILAGDPLFALTGTQGNAESLDRATGVGAVFTVLPRRIGEITREPILLAAVAGAALMWLRMRKELWLLLGTGAALFGAFLILGAAGLPLLTRYMLFPACIVILLAIGGLLGWRKLEPTDPWRRRWQLISVGLLVVILAFVPSQVSRLNSTRKALLLQKGIVDDLRWASHDVVKQALLSGKCEFRYDPAVIALPNHRAIPQVNLWFGERYQYVDRFSVIWERPRVLSMGQVGAVKPIVSFIPSSERLARGFILDKADGDGALPKPLPGQILAGRAGDWNVYSGNKCLARQIGEYLRNPSLIVPIS